jgi:hypothetical protein
VGLLGSPPVERYDGFWAVMDEMDDGNYENDGGNYDGMAE